MMLSVQFATALLAVGSMAAPVLESRDGTSDERLKQVSEQYKGIHWDEAAKDCTQRNFEILVESTRMGLELASFTPNPNPNPYGYQFNAEFLSSPGFKRFFVDSDEWSTDKKMDIISNIHQIGQFALRGPLKDRHKTRQWRIEYSCFDKQNRCPSGPTAYTNCPESGCVTTFCPGFFNREYLNDFSKGYKSLDDLASLATYEHAMVHEWLHARTVGFKPQHIIDVEDTINGITDKAYGASKCREWAWANAKGNTKHIQKNTLINADSYAWALTNNWFNKKMGWNDDGTKPFEGMIKRENNDIQLQPEDTTNVAKRDDDEPIPTGPINNCLSEEICNYIGEPYEEYLNDAIAEELADPMGLLPFKSKGGCTLSVECHKPSSPGGNSINPKCSCTCDGVRWSLGDEPCAGFAGALPTPPHSIPHS